MIDITDAFRDSLPEKTKRRMRGISEWSPAPMNYMNCRIIHFSSISELASNFNNVYPCFAYLHRVRYRPPMKYMELTDNVITGHRRNAFLIQDTFGEREWMWANDETTFMRWDKTLIPEIYDDMNIIEALFGPVDVEDKELSMAVRWYEGKKLSRVWDGKLKPVVALAYANVKPG